MRWLLTSACIFMACGIPFFVYGHRDLSIILWIVGMSLALGYIYGKTTPT